LKIHALGYFIDACRVMAKRLRDVCGLPESEPLWKAGRGFIVRDLPWPEEKLRGIVQMLCRINNAISVSNPLAEAHSALFGVVNQIRIEARSQTPAFIMKIKLHHLLIALALLAGVNQAAAQTFTNLHSFFNSSDGANPYGGLVLSGNRLYGTANDGASGGNGSVFAANTDGTLFSNGTIFTNLHSFANGDGINPYDGLVLSGNTLYGTAYQGGSQSVGTVFAINTDGTGFSNLHSFSSSSDGANPFGGLILSGKTLYGTTSSGGKYGNGTVFAINTDGTLFGNGTIFTNLYNFASGSDGANPYCGLVLSGDTLYGTTAGSGSGLAPNGTVFAVSTNGTFTPLHTFISASDGAGPHSGLVLSNNILYGTASQGGSHNVGTVFALTTAGTGFTNLYNFTATSGSSATNSDGTSPNALILSSNLLYGTSTHGGSAGNGTVFAVSTNGTGFTNLYSFSSSANSDGANSKAGLIISSNVLYGTASQGGSHGNGTVFAFNLNSSTSTPPAPIPLTIQLAGNAVVLSWTNSTFALQSAPLVTGTYTNIPGATTPYTNLISGAQQFFRLLHP
jgi:uncharacterized repeat protein (TIGR03803 family)